jgi:hypothetical protein
MSNSARYTPQFDCLETKVLRSHGSTQHAGLVDQAVVRHFSLGGTLGGLPWGTAEAGGYEVVSFLVLGRAGSMGKVSGSFELANVFVPTGKLPNLTGASLLLANRKGGVDLTFKAFKPNHYDFKIAAGSGAYISAFGSGILTIKASPNPSSLDFVIKLRSTA